jgi:hypothetical protein
MSFIRALASDSVLMYLRATAHSSCCSASTAPARRMRAGRLGKIPTTSVRRRSSLLSRSFNRPWGLESREVSVTRIFGDSVQVSFEVGDDASVPLDLAGPASGRGVLLELADVVELRGEDGCELRRGGEVVAGLTNVCVGAGFGDQMPGAVASCQAGLTRPKRARGGPAAFGGSDENEKRRHLGDIPRELSSTPWTSLNRKTGNCPRCPRAGAIRTSLAMAAKAPL